VRTAVSDAIGDVVRTVSGLKGRITGALGNVGSLLYNSGRSLISGFISGIKSMLGSVGSAAKSVVQKARDFFGSSPAKVGPLSGKGWTLYSGHAFASDFAAGIRANQSLVASAAGRLVSGAAAPVSAGQGVASLLSSTRTAQTVTAQAAAPNVSVNTSAPRVTVMIGNKVINDHVQVLIDDNNATVARQLAQGVRT
jgi:phage-related protein